MYLVNAEFMIDAVDLHELVVVALLHQLTAHDATDLVGVPNRRQTMRNHDRRAPFARLCNKIKI